MTENFNHLFEFAYKSVVEEGGDGEFHIICKSKENFDKIVADLKCWRPEGGGYFDFTPQQETNNYFCFGIGEEYICVYHGEPEFLATYNFPRLYWW